VNNEKPYLPTHINMFKKCKKGCKLFYNILNTQDSNCANYQIKWHTILNKVFSIKEWRIINEICFHTINNNYIIWFQYRIIHRILGTKSYLFQINKAENPICNLCKLHDETIQHLLVECEYTQNLWQSVINWVRNKTEIFLQIVKQDKILGYFKNKTYKIPINTIIMVTKQYIFNNCQNNRPLNIYELQIKLNTIYQEEKYIAKLNNKEENFNTVWDIWNQMFQ